MMKILGIAFSARREGNCLKTVEYVLSIFKEKGIETEVINTFHAKIYPCSHCAYECFNDKECPVADDVPDIYIKCQTADSLVFAVPTYGGHLSSLYFAFKERGQSVRCKDFLKRVNLIVIGNLSSGGDMALHEALYDFTVSPETLLLSADEYGRHSLEGDLIEVSAVRLALDRFADRIMGRIHSL